MLEKVRRVLKREGVEYWIRGSAFALRLGGLNRVDPARFGLSVEHEWQMPSDIDIEVDRRFAEGVRQRLCEAGFERRSRTGLLHRESGTKIDILPSFYLQLMARVKESVPKNAISSVSVVSEGLKVINEGRLAGLPHISKLRPFRADSVDDLARVLARMRPGAHIYSVTYQEELIERLVKEGATAEEAKKRVKQMAATLKKPHAYSVAIMILRVAAAKGAFPEVFYPVFLEEREDQGVRREAEAMGVEIPERKRQPALARSVIERLKRKGVIFTEEFFRSAREESSEHAREDRQQIQQWKI